MWRRNRPAKAVQRQTWHMRCPRLVLTDVNFAISLADGFYLPSLTLRVTVGIDPTRVRRRRT